MVFFSRKETPSAAPVNPWVVAGEDGETQSGVETSEVVPARDSVSSRKGGRPTAAHPRTRRVSMSLTEEEHATWTAAAGERGLSAWAREQVTTQLMEEQPRGNGAEVGKLRADLGRVGSNLNQLVRAVNSGLAPSSSELLEAVQATREEMARVRGELP